MASGTIWESHERRGLKANWFAPNLTGAKSRLASFQLYTRVLGMFLRGTFTLLFLAGAKGKLFVGRGARVSNPQYLSIRGRVIIEDYAELQAISSRGVTLGDQVSIGRYAMIRPSGNYAHEVGEGLFVGDRSSIGPYCFIGCSGFINIGNDVMLGPGVRLFGENHVYERSDITIKSQGVQLGGITIEDDCWIASGVTVTAGVTIGRGSVVGAGSVVTKDVAPFSIVAGVPARLLRSRKDS